MEKEERDGRIKRLKQVEKESWVVIELISLIEDINVRLEGLEEFIGKKEK